MTDGTLPVGTKQAPGSHTNDSQFSIRRQYAAARDVLDEARDILLGRVDSLPVPWAEARGWSHYLLSLSDDALTTADTRGIGRWFLTDPDCPQSLRALAQRVEELCVLPRWYLPEDPSKDPSTDWPFTGARKRRQIAAVLHLLHAFYPRISELVDVGAGRGQMTTRAARALAIPTVGLERNSERVAVARLLAGDAKVDFVTTDVLT
jgi:hypothetical protein